MFGSAESEKVRLISREIIFQEFEPTSHNRASRDCGLGPHRLPLSFPSSVRTSLAGLLPSAARGEAIGYRISVYTPSQNQAK